MAEREGAPAGREEPPVPERDRPPFADRVAPESVRLGILESARLAVTGSPARELAVVDLEGSRLRPEVRGGPAEGRRGRVEDELLCFEPDRPTVAP